jgi:hypothetical protein
MDADGRSVGRRWFRIGTRRNEYRDRKREQERLYWARFQHLGFTNSPRRRMKGTFERNRGAPKTRVNCKTDAVR